SSAHPARVSDPAAKATSASPPSAVALLPRRRSTGSRPASPASERASSSLSLVSPFVLRAEPFQLLRVQAHAERQAHLAQDRLDLVQRLLAEVLGLLELGLRLLHEIGDGPDVRGLEAVRGADRELELVDVAEEVLVELGARTRLVALGGLFLRRRHREIHQELEVVLQDARGLADRGGRADAAVGPHL